MYTIVVVILLYTIVILVVIKLYIIVILVVVKLYTIVILVEVRGAVATSLVLHVVDLMFLEHTHMCIPHIYRTKETASEREVMPRWGRGSYRSGLVSGVVL